MYTYFPSLGYKKKWTQPLCNMNKCLLNIVFKRDKYNGVKSDQYDGIKKLTGGNRDHWVCDAYMQDFNKLPLSVLLPGCQIVFKWLV